MDPKDRRDLRVRREIPDFRESRVSRETLEIRDPRVSRETPELLETRDLKASPERLEARDLKASRDLRDRQERATPARQIPTGQGPGASVPGKRRISRNEP